MEFEWDIEKARLNQSKHGVSFEEACTVFDDDYSSTVMDPAHSEGEVRFLTFGVAKSGLGIVVAHTDRGDRIRIISARPMTPKERRAYEQ
jgi:uncharacterized DUF497 family protein